MRINRFIFGLLVVVVFFGTIFVFQSAGIWSTSGRIDSTGRVIQPSSIDVTTIKGWMTLDQIANAYGVPVEDIIDHFNLPPTIPSTTAIKDLESDTFSVDSLRTWLSEK